MNGPAPSRTDLVDEAYSIHHPARFIPRLCEGCHGRWPCLPRRLADALAGELYRQGATT